MRIFGKYLALIGFCLAVIWTVILSLTLIFFHRFVPAIRHPVRRLWGGGWCYLLGIKVTIFNLERVKGQTGVIFAPNHESMFDILVLSSLPIEFRWIAKEELLKIPFLSGAMRAEGAYFLKRNRSARDLGIMREVEDGLRSGVSVAIFPEGTRTRSGELLPFKKGAFRTAQNAGVPLIPVAIAGTFKIAAPGKIPEHWGSRVVVNFGEPMTVPFGEEVTTVMDRYRSRLIELLAEAQSRM